MYSCSNDGPIKTPQDCADQSIWSEGIIDYWDFSEFSPLEKEGRSNQTLMPFEYMGLIYHEGTLQTRNYYRFEPTNLKISIFCDDPQTKVY